MTVYLLNEHPVFPDPEGADESGVVAIGGDLSPARLLAAYSSGIFPWFSEGEPLMWWSPNPRFVLFPDELKIRRSLRKVFKKKPFEIRYDTAFDRVIRYCSQLDRPEQDGTWITDDMIEAYKHFHRMGYAHSVEIFLHNQLAGGLYGVALGPFFFGESMFHLESDASKAALAALVFRFKNAPFIDCQVHNNFFESMGAVHIPRTTFLATLRALINQPNQWEASAATAPSSLMNLNWAKPISDQ